MAKSQQTFNKIEKEKQRAKKREEKQKKKEERKANPKGSDFDIAYVDEFGNLTDTPPDPSRKIEVDAEDIVLGVPKKEEGEQEDTKKDKEGKVSFFDHSKGFGFIIDDNTQEKYFVHVSGLIDEIDENDRVTYELERGMKGMNAVRVKKI
ncbi:cold shock domain-containing protein [Antarcticibacterium flavum]|uniref:Cold shock domain-containing protein n=1 Tax=Antarcticibacterium flavum TaxID=2058175 RepID=A0A5B7X0F2_9FLAO|nr:MULTISPECIES: cold shock domain-containing protein [Antarcticibacterium]MCM4158906.1 DNA-binding protein [Antarcticibacterium sp. W02-3]QCY68162.1 cold shock domain-containing protein [Antarcticibacterium flavum]